MPNLPLVAMKDLSSFRKIALGTWRTAYDPSIYGTLVLRMDRGSTSSHASALAPGVA